ncbi:MAG: hypothetical protein OSB21_14875 [Myxococcota bacterium]|nr:hypothetical protein [Myxococcota bacterium]
MSVLARYALKHQHDATALHYNGKRMTKVAGPIVGAAYFTFDAELTITWSGMSETIELSAAAEAAISAYRGRNDAWPRPDQKPTGYATK